ncbi:MAG: serine hydrolase [Chloroflexi bacterium]|nr:serine hydrolase [Chloroflexota bacterium]
MQMRKSLFTRLILFLTAAVIVPSTLSAPSSTQPTAEAVAQGVPTVTAEMLAQFEAMTQEELDYFHIPGAAVAVVQDDEIVYARGFGVRDLETGAPFTTQTQMRIGSTTKSMTSMMIATLVDDGLLNWDTPVTELLPGFATPDAALTARLTVADLMSMETGLIATQPDAMYWDEMTSVDDLLAIVAHQRLESDLHTRYSYNNEVYASVGYAGAAAAGLPVTLDSYRQLMQERILTPIDMPSAVITDDHRLLSDNYAQVSYGYSLLDGTDQPSLNVDAPETLVAPAGGVWTHIEDMARYLITQVTGGLTPGGRRIVSEESLARTWQPGQAVMERSPSQGNLYYAMGWVIAEDAAPPYRTHSGGWKGYRTFMMVYPEARVGLIVFMNSMGADFLQNALGENFGQLLYGLEPSGFVGARAQFDMISQQLQQLAASVASPQVDPVAVAPLLGAYEHGWMLGCTTTIHSGWCDRIGPSTCCLCRG